MSTVPLPEQFRVFAQGAAKDGATTYDVICNGVADDPDILALLAEAPLRQRRPNILLAAVHFLLLSGTQHPLARHYDTVRSVGGGGAVGGGAVGGGAGGAVGGDSGDNPQGPPHSDLVADFKEFCLKHRAELLELLATRSTQTNEVGRCTALLPAINLIAARHPGQPLSLLDLGTSAGLNLLFDSYDYTYHQRDGGAVLTLGRADAKVHLECTVRGELSALPPLSLPGVAGRFGIDAAPIDPTSGDGAEWLLACLWPDNLARFTRLREALAIARTTPHPPEVYQGDIIDDLPAVVDHIARSGPLIVFHSWVAAYLSPQRQGNSLRPSRHSGACRARARTESDSALPVRGGIRRNARASDAAVSVTPPHVPSGDGSCPSCS